VKESEARARRAAGGPWIGRAVLAVALAGGAQAALRAPRADEPRAGAPGAGAPGIPGAPGGPGLAIRASKALVAELDGRQVVDDALLLVRDGRIEAVDAAATLAVPEGYELFDARPLWLAPGMIDLHSHQGGTRGDINDMVYQTNPGLRVSPAVVAGNELLDTGVAAGITTILFIPGSGTNLGGQGILMKTAFETYEEALVRFPGSLKIAQGDNPTRWGYGMGRLLMNHHLRSVLRQGRAYAERWKAADEGRGARPERDLRLDVFRDLFARTTQVSTHTQYYQLVMMSIRMLAVEFGLDAYIDHGSFDSYLNAGRAEAAGVAAILGPREVLWPLPPRYDTDGQVHGTAWGFQQRGHSRIGFNTDAGVIPQWWLPNQAAMGVRYGMDDTNMDAVRGVTIVPAATAGLGDRLGSLEAGKDADLVLVSGDPNDPRSSVERVWIGGRIVYDAERDGRRW